MEALLLNIYGNISNEMWIFNNNRQLQMRKNFGEKFMDENSDEILAIFAVIPNGTVRPCKNGRLTPVGVPRHCVS